MFENFREFDIATRQSTIHGLAERFTVVATDLRPGPVNGVA
jgi:hypothetical protein